MFDIKSVAVAKTADCKLTNVDNSPLKNDKGARCSITMFGPASDEFAAVGERRRNRSDKYIAENGEAAVPFEVQREWAAEDLAMVTKSFNGFTYQGDFQDDRARFKAAYLDKEIGFITQQADGFYRLWGNFSAASKTS